jgi:cyclopropane-fatty-acyl-phospholipid synthase
MLASPAVFRRQAQGAGLAVRSAHSFGLDYAETLKRWNQNFQRAWGDIQHTAGFDARFKRLWHFYLSYCEAGFRAATTDVLQLEMAHA